MLTHSQIWGAIDALAGLAGTSPSGLAKRAGLDPTTFNKSKRITSDQRQRWPSTESVAKALAATNTSLDILVQLIGESGRNVAQALPLIGFAQIANPTQSGATFDDAGIPVGKGWDEIAFPAVDDENAYAIEVSDNSLEGAYRDGTVLVVSPNASIRRGDRVVVKIRSGEVIAKELVRKTSKGIELKSLNPAQPDRTLATEDYLWIARIVWASQ